MGTLYCKDWLRDGWHHLLCAEQTEKVKHKGYNHIVKFMVTIHVDEDGFFIVDCPALPGCMSQGKTRDEALANISEAIELNIESRHELELPIYSDTAEIEIPA